MSGAGRQDFTDKAGAALKVIIPISLTQSVRHLTASLRFFSPTPRSPPPSTSVICSRERLTLLPPLFNPTLVPTFIRQRQVYLLLPISNRARNQPPNASAIPSLETRMRTPLRSSTRPRTPSVSEETPPLTATMFKSSIL